MAWKEYETVLEGNKEVLNDIRSMLTGMGRWIGVMRRRGGGGKTSKSDRKALKDDESVKNWLRCKKSGEKTLKGALNGGEKVLNDDGKAVHGDGEAVKGDKKALKGDHEALNDDGKALKCDGEEIKGDG